MADSKELPYDHPARVAFREYQNTSAYENNRKWAQFSEYADGSLWSVFVAGMAAQSKLNATATPPADAALADAMSKIEDAIGCDRMPAAMVFTKMREIVNAALRSSPVVKESLTTGDAALAVDLDCAAMGIRQHNAELADTLNKAAAALRARAAAPRVIRNADDFTAVLQGCEVTANFGQPHPVDILRSMAQQTGWHVDHAAFDQAKDALDNVIPAAAIAGDDDCSAIILPANNDHQNDGA